MPGLRKISGKQAAINSATQTMLQQMLSENFGKNGKTPGKKTGNSLRKEAQTAQLELAEQLRQLEKQYGNNAGESLKNRVKELEKEAERLAKMLKNPQPGISDHQERFLVRLLQTTLSINKQGKGKNKRKSTASSIIFSQPQKLTSEKVFKDSDSFFRIRSNALSGNYPESYRLHIQEYFDSLGVLFLKEQ